MRLYVVRTEGAYPLYYGAFSSVEEAKAFSDFLQDRWRVPKGYFGYEIVDYFETHQEALGCYEEAERRASESPRNNLAT